VNAGVRQSFWREQVKVHPDEGDHGKKAEHANDDGGRAFGPVGGC
jgi:hypothetical protein